MGLPTGIMQGHPPGEAGEGDLHVVLAVQKVFQLQVLTGERQHMLGAGRGRWWL